MATILVLFNLKPGVSPERYEAWARSTDLPIVRVASVEALRTNIAATPAMAEVARQFREFADSPQFIVTEAI